MIFHDHVAAINRHGTEIADAFRLGMDAPVRACGSWRVGDLLWHVGEVHRFWAAIARSSSPTDARHQQGERPSDIDMLTWYESGVAELIDALTSVPLDTSCWTWAGPQNIEWLARRMAHETAVHSWDALWAAGKQPTISPELATDGIDEFLHVMTPLVREGQPVVGGSVHIHCTDVHGEWFAVPGDGLEMIVTREHAKGSVAMRGAAVDLLLVLWRRLPLEVIEVFGDESVAHRFLMRADLD